MAKFYSLAKFDNSRLKMLTTALKWITSGLCLESVLLADNFQMLIATICNEWLLAMLPKINYQNLGS
ncbi:hypothetical protein AD945_02845 [Gluconobacter albidus]|uniref:Uncharacterized protein n=1 Tax=Gluconobacter albidus TaxID=318683 RepID=A0A149TMH0_9PROT|nr:hypothetical protein AD945_02845 [Gluconobacter albidus]